MSEPFYDPRDKPTPALLPHDKEAEQGVLGAIIQNNDALGKVEGFLTPEMFFSPSHRILYQTSLKLAQAGMPIDEVTLGHILKDENKLDQVGGFVYIAELVDVTPSASNVLVYASIVLEKWQERMVITAALDTAAAVRANHESAEVLADKLMQTVTEIRNANYTPTHIDLRQLIVEIGEELERPEDAGGRVWTYTSIDKVIPPLPCGDLTYLLSASGHGKSAFAFQVGFRNAYMDVPVLAFTLEMKAASIVKRQLASEMRINNQTFFNRKRPLNDQKIWDGFSDAGARIAGLEQRLFIEKPPGGITCERMRSVARTHVANNGVRLMIVDYLDLVQVPRTSKSGSEFSDQNYRSGFLKELATELDIAILCLAQVNTEGIRYAEKKHDEAVARAEAAKKNCSDILRAEEIYNRTLHDHDTGWENWHFDGSRKPLRDADDVLVLYDPDTKNKGMVWDADRDGPGKGGMRYTSKRVLLKSAKGRNGPGGLMWLTFEPWSTTYDRAHWEEFRKRNVQYGLHLDQPE